MANNSNPGGVCAVIVTYNRLNLLKKCLEGVRSQTRPPDRIVVVNNASTDGTTEWLSSVPGVNVLNQANSGSSGGQGAGFCWARDHGCAWIWCCDDDVRPKPDALARMLDVGTRHQACILTLKQFDDGAVQQLKNYFCPLTAKRLNRPPVMVEPGVESVNFGNFEGMLIPRRVVDAIGIPDRRFFVCGDDIIYGFLASRTGPVLLHREPLFDKLVPRPPAKPKWKGPRLRMTDFQVYFFSRNRWLCLKILKEAGTLKPGAYLQYFKVSLQEAIYILLFDKSKIKRLELLASGFIDALQNRWGGGRLIPSALVSGTQPA